MNAANAPAPQRDAVRLLHVDRRAQRLTHTRASDLTSQLRPGDLLVANDAATLPASLHGTTQAGDQVELRLLGPVSTPQTSAVLLGRGDWRKDTNRRPAPPHLAPGDLITLGRSLQACVLGHSPLSPRLIQVQFNRQGAALLRALYRHGKPVQYSHLRREEPLWSFQTLFAERPWAAEMPSAGRSLSAHTLQQLARQDIGVTTLTHAAGLSATGDPALDAALPLPEVYELPAHTVHRVQEAIGGGGRVVAVGTTVVRALEGCVAQHGALRAGTGETNLIVGPGFQPQIVDGLLSGLHEPHESHFQLLRAFCPDALLRAAIAEASAHGYRSHEFGDQMLVL